MIDDSVEAVSVEVAEAVNVSSDNGASETAQRAAAVAGGAIEAGFAGALAVSKNLDATKQQLQDTVLICLPDDWAEDEDARKLIASLDDTGCAVVLAWLGAQWRDGYGAAVNDHESGRPFIVAPGGRPIVETVSDDAAQ